MGITIIEHRQDYNIGDYDPKFSVEGILFCNEERDHSLPVYLYPEYRLVIEHKGISEIK